MPLPGGPSNKIGNRYEMWWTVSQLVRIMDGEVLSIRIEAPIVEKAEFVLTTQDGQEHHQAKRSHVSGKWSLFSLKQENLLQTIFDQLSKNTSVRFVFTSGSDTPELRELIDRALSAKNLEEFKSVFVSAKTHNDALEKLKDIWHADTATAYRILQQLEVRTIDEKGLEDQVRESVLVRFLTNRENVCETLRSIVQDSVHKTIDRKYLISVLQDRGFALRKLMVPNNTLPLVDDVTDGYLETVRHKLILGSLITRDSTQELLAKIKGKSIGCDFVLTGKAGGGKTVCVMEAVEALRKSDDPFVVLAFRLDRIDPVSSTKELGERLDLEESPALVLATAAEATSSDAVLVIDQLDAVSTTSGRSSEFLDVVEVLLSEVQVLRDKVNFHVVVVCREFDWKNEHRLRRLLPKDSTNINVTDFSLEEVSSVLGKSGFNTGLFGVKQLDLLCLPQNLYLFLDTDPAPDSIPEFLSPKDLFDRYWTEKRKAVNARVALSSDFWQEIILMLCDEMTRTQQLSVLKEKLDRFPEDYLNQMASEGVLSFDGNRYGFGHESFFDYCFARNFVANEESLTEFLVKSEQHLFRRAQVRQVLVYLHDADHGRYCKELQELLTDKKIRYHLKDLAVNLAFTLQNPNEKEWDVFAPWIESEIEMIKNGKPNPDKFANLVWSRFFSTYSWFQITYRKGLITDWLTSGNDNIVNTGVDYVRCHQRHSGDRAAELLEPFVGINDEWRQRLCQVMQWVDHGNSRRFFDLFLKLIDDGTLDDARDTFASNGTFWGMLSSLGKKRLVWIPEVLAHWLSRRFLIIQNNRDSLGRPKWHDLFNNDESGSEDIFNSATKFPDKFVRHVLPVILEIADRAVKEKIAPKKDAVWGTPINSEYNSISEVCRKALTRAVENLAETKSDCIAEILAEIKSHDTNLANYLLQHAFTAGAVHFADDAVSDLCEQSWRFECGYSDSPYWIAIQLIKEITPLCSDENRARLEKAILNYTTNYEQTPDGYKLRGHACFNLLSGIPVELRSKNARSRFAELERKFGKTISTPQKIKAYRIDSPIEKSAAEKMTDEQWLSAIKKYNSEERHNWENLEKGTALELARMLQECVKQEPKRFSQLSLRFPKGTHPFYIEHTLNALKGATASTELKLEVCRKAYTETPIDCGKALVDLLGSMEEPLPNDAMQMLDWLATVHPDPEEELWNKKTVSGDTYYGGDILTYGINTTRGRAALAIRDLIQRDKSYIQHFQPTIKHLANDKSVSVRACVSSTLLAISNHEPEFALEQFLGLVKPRGSQIGNERLLSTYEVERFVNFGLNKHFGRLRDVIERMLRSELPETAQVGARLASIALLLHHENAKTLVEEALHGHALQRMGVAQVATRNIGHSQYRQWSEQNLLMFFDDDDRDVRAEAATCFRSMEGQSMESFENLITKFCDSAAYQEDSFSLLNALEDSSHRLPGITYNVCKIFLERFSDEARDFRTRRSGDSRSVTTLLLRTYHQHQQDEWASKCLNPSLTGHFKT